MELYKPYCPNENCMSGDIYEQNIMNVVEKVTKLDDHNQPQEYAGESKVIWDTVRPDPEGPRFVCMACGEMFDEPILVLED